MGKFSCINCFEIWLRGAIYSWNCLFSSFLTTTVDRKSLHRGSISNKHVETIGQVLSNWLPTALHLQRGKSCLRFYPDLCGVCTWVIKPPQIQLKYDFAKDTNKKPCELWTKLAVTFIQTSAALMIVFYSPSPSLQFWWWCALIIFILPSLL